MGQGVQVLGRAVPEPSGGVPGPGGCPSLWGWQKYCPRLRTQACPTSGRYPKSRVSVTRSRMGGTYSSSAGRCWGRAVLSPQGATGSTHGWGGPPHPSTRPHPHQREQEGVDGEIGVGGEVGDGGGPQGPAPALHLQAGCLHATAQPPQPPCQHLGGAPSGRHPLWGALSAQGSPQMGWMPGGMLKASPSSSLSPSPSPSCPPLVSVPLCLSPSSSLSLSLSRLHPLLQPCPHP